MSKQDIFRVLMSSRFARVFTAKHSCHLWLWATSNYLADALWLMQVLGFEYKTSAVWVKGRPIVARGHNDDGHEVIGPRFDLQIGLGQYMRHAHEWLLLGVRGPSMVPSPENRMPSVIIAPKTRHSEKPPEAYELIESTTPGPRLEMFARAPRDGWTVWGNEVDTTTED